MLRFAARALIFGCLIWLVFVGAGVTAADVAEVRAAAARLNRGADRGAAPYEMTNDGERWKKKNGRSSEPDDKAKELLAAAGIDTFERID